MPQLSDLYAENWGSALRPPCFL